MTTRGNCYERAFLALMDGWHNDLLESDHPMGEPRFVLVHGYPKLTADVEGHPEGTKFGHAWLELVVRTPEGHDFVMYVVDCGALPGSERTILPKFIYYNAGSIDESECSVYELREALENARNHEHYGPWVPDEELPEGVVFG